MGFLAILLFFLAAVFFGVASVGEPSDRYVFGGASLLSLAGALTIFGRAWRRKRRAERERQRLRARLENRHW